MKIVSWNVNGIVACRRKGFLKFLSSVTPDIMCCQEIKTEIPLSTPGYTQFWNSGKRPGYAGTLILTRNIPLSISKELGIDEFDEEGRFQLLEFDRFYLANLYAPSTWGAREKLDRRLEWDTALRVRLSVLDKPAILCGDFNVAHTELDNYPGNVRNDPSLPKFYTEERAGMDRLLEMGFVDAFRAMYPGQEGAYTWWSPKNDNRVRNRGSRLDYFLVDCRLLSQVRRVRHYTNTLGSDHCPIAMCIRANSQHRTPHRGDLSAQWRTIDWARAEEHLFSMQKELAQAADQRNWGAVEVLQKKITNSWTARVLAVRAVASANSATGVDGARLLTDESKMETVLSLNTRNYYPLPYRFKMVDVSIDKKRALHLATARDKAMQTLYAYALDPVQEALSDRKSFSARKGRSALDLHAYLQRDLSGPDAPGWVSVIDVKAYYGSIIHEILIAITPMDKAVLRKFLTAGLVRDGELFETNRGISLGTSLSPLLGNILLNGLQSYIYDHLYPSGKVDYLDGGMYRFADDILVTARSRRTAEHIMEIVQDFLYERGLRINSDKSYIASLSDGFDYLARRYRRVKGQLVVEPSGSSIRKSERELELLILGHHGPLRDLVVAVNNKLTGWGSYHRVEDSYMVFRHIDAVVTGLMVERLCGRHPRWHQETILKKYFVKEGWTYVFQLPDDPSCRIHQLSPTNIVHHKPCRLDFNPYLDEDYHRWLQNRRDIQKASGRYKAIWQRQNGRCAVCGQEILPDHEIELVERHLGDGWKLKNLVYIHCDCRYDALRNIGTSPSDGIDLMDRLSGFLHDTPPEKSPYYELREFFRLSEQTPISLTFEQIEEILGDPLDWEAYFYTAFWYDEFPGYTSPLWNQEGYPFHMFIPTTMDYCISEAWLSQGYIIKALHLEERRVVFRHTGRFRSGLKVPKALVNEKLPDQAVYECQRFSKYLCKKYGL